MSSSVGSEGSSGHRGFKNDNCKLISPKYKVNKMMLVDINGDFSFGCVLASNKG